MLYQSSIFGSGLRALSFLVFSAALFTPSLFSYGEGVAYAFPPDMLHDTLYGHRAYAERGEDALLPAGKYRDTGRTVKLYSPAAIAFIKMRRAASADGVDLVPISGFRKVSYQEGLFTRAARKYGTRKAAARWVAPPGYSEHHTGLAVDIGDKLERSCDVETCFEDTPSFKWLKANAEGFGFELSFPPEGVVSYEPWHWRYVPN